MTDADKEKIKALTMAGVPTRQISEQMFYHNNTIKYWCRKMGLLKAKDYCDGRIGGDKH